MRRATAKSFAVSSREDLDAWAQRFSDAGVMFSPVAAANSIPGAAALVFRDPDNIQLELFFDPSPNQPFGPLIAPSRD